MKVFLVLLLAGLCSGIQYPLQYVYHYRAKVASGIADINKRHSAISELRADLRVYVTSPTTVVFKLADVSFGDFNGPRDCEYHTGHGSSWATPQPASQLGQFPFSVENGLFIFNAEEEQWTINFYKSIISLFSIAPLKEAFYHDSGNHSHSAAYTATEDTVMGMCTTTYTQHKLAGVAAAQREQFMEHHVTQDVQAGSLGEYVTSGSSKTTKTTQGLKTSSGPRRRRRATKRPPSKTSKTSPNVQRAPAISNTLWEVVRSVNLEDCEDRIEHQHSLGGLYCLLSKDQCQNLLSRNSHGVYYLRGNENGMRLEKASVKGAIVISPYGYETEHIETITKQKLALVSVNHLDIDAPSLTGDATVTTDQLVYKLTLPYQGAQNNYRWATTGTMKETLAALTGVYITEELQQENEERVISMVNLATNLVASGSSEGAQKVPVLLNYASILMYDFTKEEITRVSAGLQGASRELFYGVLAEVGTQPAVELMLSLIKRGEVSAFRQVIYFGSLNMNIKSAAGLRPLLNFLKSQNLDEAPFKTSQSLINFASVVRRLCLSRRDTGNSFATFAYQRCAEDGIVSELQQYLVTKLQGATQFWKQMVLVRALVNLKSVEATNAVLPYVLGARECDETVRAVAMDSLAKWNAAGPQYRSSIVLILLDIFENPGESRVLRSRALGYLASWDLTSTEWTRLAFTTKRPGLKDLAALTYSLIKSTAEFEHPEMIKQRQYAQHALHIAKPSSAADRYSSFQSWIKYSFDNQIGQINHFSAIQDPMSPLPAELSSYIERNLGGVLAFRKAEFMISNDDGDLVNIALQLFRGQGGRPSRADSKGGRWTNFLNMLKTDLNIEEKARTAIRGVTSMIGAAQMQLFIPFEITILADMVRGISDSAPDVNLVGPAPFYMNLVDNTFTTVNDLGLPVITNVARASLLSFRGSTQININNPGTVSVNTDSFGAISSSLFRVNIETMIPWSHSKVAAGVSNTVVVNLPVSPQIEFSWNPLTEDPTFFTSAVFPSASSKIALLTKVNMPYTLIRDTAPANLDGVAGALKIIYTRGDAGPQHKSPTNLGHPLLTAIYTADFDAKSLLADLWSSDSNAFALALDKLVLFPNLKFYSDAIFMDFTPMKNFAIRLNFTSVNVGRLSNAGKLVSKYGQDSFQDYELCGQEDSAGSFTQQTGQQASEDYMYEQSSQSVQSPDQEFESFGSFGQQQAQAPAQLYDPTETETVRPSQGIGDVAQPQLNSFLNYLQQQAGWKSFVRGASIRIEALNAGAVSAAYEIVWAQTKCFALVDQVLTKSVLVLGMKGDPCNTLCFEVESTSPTINDLDTLETVVNKNLNVSRNTNIYTGRKCSEGPIQSIHDEQQLTETGRQHLIEKMEDLQQCKGHWGRQTDILKEFVEAAEYDRTEYTTNATVANENIQCNTPFAKMFMTQGWPMLREKVFKMKNFAFCPGDLEPDSQGRTEIQASGVATRTEEKGTWDWHETFGEKDLQQSLPATGFWLDDVHKIGWQSDYQEHGDYCIIDGSKVTTFDGMRSNFTATVCPVLVSTPCEEGQHDAFAVAVKTNRAGGLAIHVAGQVRQFIINVDAEGIDVNNVPMAADEYVKTLYYTADGEQREAGHLYKRRGFFKVEIDDTVDVLFKEGKVYIDVADRYRGYMCGLCGNYDDEPSNDMKAPNGCLIAEPEEFAKAWTPSTGFDCFAEQQTDSDTCLKEEPLPHDYYQQYRL